MSFPREPHWYKDAIIYELHVRAYRDSNGDGIGDFRGLIEKLDYLQDLGVNAVWILPFYPSPFKDDGYDIADYYGVHPQYGTIKDFKHFVREAHKRNIRVITELVVNHTSDQHPWFQAARRAKAGSARRNFYVWSKTGDKFPETRIIFCDTEKSNWSWDPEANGYYWHRFYSSQPDLNHNNPKVVQAMLKVMRYWLDFGVDGMRLDAVPYLCVREGTNNENLSETHEAIKTFRQTIDQEYADKMLLAEANQWPEDVVDYFGEGDECHMAYHFPLMPRIFMAIRQEDRLPITEIMARTPAIPQTCQWALFLRNHDELTLEMVTDEERDYMYTEYATDPRMRLNVGIRRRLAPLVDNDRRTIEMMNSLLFSFPGTPIIYYGDEIGMGDNIYLGDRHGVRTPMQWTIDRNAGFSDADPARLYQPLIMDPVYGYQAVNVEAQQRDPSSLLQFMKRLIALRLRYKAFGRGTLEFLHPRNRKILAYIRRYKREVILCVVNLSRNIQPAELELPEEFKDWTPMEMIGRTEFPQVGELPYFLTLGPHAFYWFKLEKQAEPIRLTSPMKAQDLTFPKMDLETGWESLWETPNRQILENDILPQFLPRQHWYLESGKPLSKVRLMDWAKTGANFYLTFIHADYENEPTRTYCLPIRMTVGAAAQKLVDEFPQSVLSWIRTPKGDGVLYDALYDETACQMLYASIEEARSYPTGAKGTVKAYSQFWGSDGSMVPEINGVIGDKSNTSILYDEKMVLKLFRLMTLGPNPEVEIRRYLTEVVNFPHVPKIIGGMLYTHPSIPLTALSLMQEYVPNSGTGWQYLHDELTQFFIGMAHRNEAPPEEDGAILSQLDSHIPEWMYETAGQFIQWFRLLGERTAQLHIALGQECKQVEFKPEPMTKTYLETLSEQVGRQALELLEWLNSYVNTLSEPSRSLAEATLHAAPALTDGIQSLPQQEITVSLIRSHGQFHLNKLLIQDEDLMIIDFGGDRTLTLTERRRKQSPLRDVAAMIHSIQTLAHHTLQEYQTTQVPAEVLPAWSWTWQKWMIRVFVHSYLREAKHSIFIPERDDHTLLLLSTFLLEAILKDAHQHRAALNPEPLCFALHRLRDLTQSLPRPTVK